MKKKVMIRLLTKQTAEEQEPETLEIATQGTLEKTPDGLYIEYNEPDEGMGKTVCGILINNPELVTMTRSGDFNANLVLEKGVRHNCLYETPFGSVVMGVFSSDVNVLFTEDGGTVNMKYTIDINSEMLSENRVTMDVKIID